MDNVILYARFGVLTSVLEIKLPNVSAVIIIAIRMQMLRVF